MKFFIAVVAVASALPLPSAALAQDRAGPAALGALSGAVVLGPVGLVAGAVIGYTAGPSIGRSLGIRRGNPDHRARHAGRSVKPATRMAARPRAPSAGEISPVQPAKGTGGPPAQGLE